MTWINISPKKTHKWLINTWKMINIISHCCCCCCCSVAKSCLTLCGSLDYSMPGYPVFHYLLEFAQTHVHWVGDAIQPSHPLSPPSPSAFNLFQWVGSSHQVSKVLELQLQHQSFQWIFRVDFLSNWLVWSPHCPRACPCQEFSPAPQFENISSLVLSLLCGPTLTSVNDYWKNHGFNYTDHGWQSDISAF